MVENLPDLYRATHEAGHFVMAYFVWLDIAPICECEEPPLNSVTISSSRNYLGSCDKNRRSWKEMRERRPEAAIAVNQAGRFATELFTQPVPDFWHEDDEQRVEGILSLFPQDREQLLTRAQQYLDRLREERWCNAIRAVAENLCQSKTLTWAQVGSIIGARSVRVGGPR